MAHNRPLKESALVLFARLLLAYISKSKVNDEQGKETVQASTTVGKQKMTKWKRQLLAF